MKKILLSKADNGSGDYFYTRESRWITIRHDVVTPKHELYDYAEVEGFDGWQGYGTLAHFKHNGRDYALGQFLRLDGWNSVELEDGTILVAYDSTNWYKPFLLEIDEYGERVRLYTEESKTVEVY